MGLWEGPGGIFSSSRFSIALWIPSGYIFAAFWGALEPMSASLGTKNMTRNWYQFAAFCRARFCLSFWSAFGSLGNVGSLLDRFSGRLSGTVSGPPFWVNFQIFGRTVLDQLGDNFWLSFQGLNTACESLSISTSLWKSTVAPNLFK